MQNKRYQVILEDNNEFDPSPNVRVHPKLPAGCYQVNYDKRFNLVTFTAMKMTHDQLIDLPDTQYDEIIKDLELFLTPECEKRHRDLGFLYKLNVFMHGGPGTGKTCIVNRVAQKIASYGGVVLFNPDPAGLGEVYKIFESIQPETRVLVILEEFDQLVHNHEATLLHALDGEVQKENVMYIATTNYVDRVPARLLRPGRFSTVIEVTPPSLKARQFYLGTKLRDKDLVSKIAEATDGFTIDELKDVVRNSFCLQKNLDDVIKKYRKKPAELGTAEEPSCDECDGCPRCCPDDFDEPEEAPRGILRAQKVRDES